MLKPSSMARLPFATMTITPTSEIATPSACSGVMRSRSTSHAIGTISTGMSELNSVALVAVVLCSAM